MFPPRYQHRVEAAIGELREAFAADEWLLKEHWPVNEGRIRRVLADALTLVDPTSGARVLDVGCFNGYVSLLFAKLGYQVAAIDSEATIPPAVVASGVEYHQINLNTLEGWDAIPAGSFDLVWMGEVIEHVFNHPLGLMKQVARVTRPGGVLLLTTPNPATVMNAVRLLRNRDLGGGTTAFLETEKVGTSGITSHPGIHYWEYRTDELQRLLERAGFGVERIRYLSLSSATGSKRLARRLFSPLSSLRLFGADQYAVARRLS